MKVLSSFETDKAGGGRAQLFRCPAMRGIAPLRRAVSQVAPPVIKHVGCIRDGGRSLPQ